jgi:hypothetical protein
MTSSPAGLPNDAALPTQPTRLQQTLQSLKDLPAVLLAAGTGLYALGLIIVNLELGIYGLVNLDLARPQYLMTGALWLFLCALNLWCWQIGSWRYRTEARGARLPIKAFFVVVGVCISLAVPAIVLVSVGYHVPSRSSPEASLWGQLLVACLVLWLNAYALKSIVERARETPDRRPEAFPSTLWPVLSSTGVHATMMLLVAVPLYIGFVFRHLPQNIGGGRKPVVYLKLNTDRPLFPDSISLRFRSEDGFGPAILLYESSTHYMIRISISPKAPLARYGSLAIDKRLVDAVIYEKPDSPIHLLLR